MRRGCALLLSAASASAGGKCLDACTTDADCAGLAGCGACWGYVCDPCHTKACSDASPCPSACDCSYGSCALSNSSTPAPAPATPSPPGPATPVPPGPAPGITTKYNYTGKSSWCNQQIMWEDADHWDPAPPTAADTAVFGDDTACHSSGAWSGVQSATQNYTSLETAAVILGGLHLEDMIMWIETGSVSVSGGVTLKNASLRIGANSYFHESFGDAGTLNAEDLRPDPAAAAKGFHACEDLPTGFQPRLCGAGTVSVDATSLLTVTSRHASVFAPVHVAAGGSLMMNNGSYAWKTVTNEGTITVAGEVYWLGELRNEQTGVVSVGHDAIFTFDLWAYNKGAATVPAQAEVVTVTNAGLILLATGPGWGLPGSKLSSFQGTAYNYSDDATQCALNTSTYPPDYTNCTGTVLGEYVGTLENTATGRLLTSDGTPPHSPYYNDYLGFDFRLINHGTVDLSHATLSRGVRNLGRMRLADSQLAASGRVANHAGAELALHRTELHGALDNAGAVRVTGTNANRWGGAVSNSGGVISVDGGDVFVTKLRSDRGAIELRNGAQVNYQSTGGGDYCWESVWKYCGCSDCSDPSCFPGCRCCPHGAAADAPLAALPPLTARFARNTTFPDREPSHPPAAGCAAAEDYAFAGTELRGDGTGSAVFSGELRLSGDAALRVSGARVFTVAEHDAAAVAGGGELVVGDGGAVHLGIDAALGAGGRVAVLDGGLLGVDPHARVTFHNHSVHVAPGGRLHVDGRAHFAAGAALRVCGARSGRGRVSGSDAGC